MLEGGRTARRRPLTRAGPRAPFAPAAATSLRYGPATTFFLGVRNSHPDALTPNPDLAYHSGGLYEVLIGAVVFAVAWSLRKRLQARPLALTWLALAMLAAGRFGEFFLRSDSADLALGLEIAQWTSIAILVVAAGGAWLTLRRQHASAERPRSPAGAASRR